jgi:hypothetical protein
MVNTVFVVQFKAATGQWKDSTQDYYTVSLAIERRKQMEQMQPETKFRVVMRTEAVLSSEYMEL